MKINEVSEATHITKRAIKFYEQKGLINISKDENGYRNFTDEDVEVLKKISLYRKLDISLQEIKQLLMESDDLMKQLQSIYNQKSREFQKNEVQLRNLKQMLDSNCSKESIDKMEEMLDYETISKALQDLVPGSVGQIFMYHFLPYLQISIQTEEQRKAYYEILKFWDDFEIRIPIMMRFTGFVQAHLLHTDMESATLKIDRNIQMMLQPSPEEYEKTKKMIRQNVRLKNSFFYKYNPFLIANRKFMKRLQDSGYNDIFIPNMMKLSPKYKEYHDALTSMNDRVCADLGLYYDSKYNLIMKKDTE